MKKKRLLFFFGPFLFFLFLFYTPLRDRLLQEGARYICKKSFGKKSDFGTVVFRKGKISLENFSLGDREEVFRKGGVYFTTEKIDIFYRWNFFSGGLRSSWELQNPEILLVPSKEGRIPFRDILTFTERSNQRRHFIRKIENGRFFFHSLKGEDTVCRYFWKGEDSLDGEIKGTFRVILSEGVFEGHIYSSREQKEAEGHLHNWDIRKTGDLISFLSPLSSEEDPLCGIRKGKWDGSFRLSQGKDGFSRCQGKWEFRDLSLRGRGEEFFMESPLLVMNWEASGRDWLLHDPPELWMNRITGSLEMPLPSSFRYVPYRNREINGVDCTGKMIREVGSPLYLSLAGGLETPETSSRAELEAKGNLFPLKGHLTLSLHKSEGIPPSCWELGVIPLTPLQRKMIFRIVRVTKEEYPLLKSFLPPAYRFLSEARMEDGFFDLHFGYLSEKGRLKEWTIEHFYLQNLIIKNFGPIGDLEGLNGEGHFNGDGKGLEGAEGECRFDFQRGTLYRYPLENVTGNFEINRGEMENAEITGIFAGISGKVIQEERAMIQASFQAAKKEFLALLPERIRKPYEEEGGGEETVVLSLEGVPEGKSLHIRGACNVQNDADFSFAFETVKNEEERKPSFEEDIFYRTFISPLKHFPALEVFTKPPSKRRYSLRNGKAEGKKIDIKKYIRPLIFGHTNIGLSGVTDIRAFFNEDRLHLQYENTDLICRHDDFYFDLSSARDFSGSGEHYFSFQDGRHFGHCEIEKGELEIREKPLVLQNIKGKLEINPSGVRAPRFSASVRNISVQGETKVDILPTKGLDLSMTLHRVAGSVEDFKHFFSDFGHSFVTEIPLEGDIFIGERGFFLFLERREVDRCRLRVNGILRNGYTTFGKKVPLGDIRAGFDFDTETRVFQIKGLQGKWFSSSGDPYEWQIPFLSKNLLAGDPCLFDLRIKNRYRDCAALKGKIFANIREEGEPIKIILDPEGNYFGHIIPTNAYCSMDKKLSVHYANVNFFTEAGTFSKDLFFMESFLPDPARSFLGRLQKISPVGEIAGQWEWNRAEEKQQFFIWSDQLKVGSIPASIFRLRGNYRRGAWRIEEFLYHKCKGTAYWQEKPLAYEIDRIRLSDGKNFLLDLSGTYCRLFHAFRLFVHDFRSDCTTLREGASLGGFRFLDDLRGELSLQGECSGGFFQDHFGYKLSFSGMGKELSLASFRIGKETLSCEAEGDADRIRLKCLSGTIDEWNQVPLSFGFSLKDGYFDFPRRVYGAEKIAFHMPVDTLQKGGKILAEKLRIPVPEAVFSLQKNGEIEGEVTVKKEETKYRIGIHLQDDKYSLFGREYDLKKIWLHFSPESRGLSFDTLFHHYPYRISLKRERYSEEMITLSVCDADQEEQNAGLCTEWSIQDPKKPLLRKISGNLGGLECTFIHKPEENAVHENILWGRAEIRDESFFTRICENFSNFRFGRGLAVTGRLVFPFERAKDFSFIGLLGGQNVRLSEYELRSFSSSVTINRREAVIQDCMISDLSGELHVPSIRVEKKTEGEEIYLSIPKMTLHKFKPGFLHKKDEDIAKH